MKKTLLVLTTVVILVTLAMPLLAADGDGITLQGFENQSADAKQLGEKLKTIIDAVAGFAGLACTAALVFFGIKLAIHSEQETEVAKIKSRMMYALVGLGIVLCSWMVVGFFVNEIQKTSDTIPPSSYVAVVDANGDYM